MQQKKEHPYLFIAVLWPWLIPWKMHVYSSRSHQMADLVTCLQLQGPGIVSHILGRNTIMLASKRKRKMKYKVKPNAELSNSLKSL